MDPLTDMIRTIVHETITELVPHLRGDEWLCLAEAATYAGGIAERVIADDARRGRITIGHAGRTPVVRRSEVDRWIEARGYERTPADSAAKDDGSSSIARAAARLRRTA